MNLGEALTMGQKEAWHTVAIDIVGPCLETTGDHKWILTMIDTFTRYPICIPLVDHKSSTIMRAIYEHLICHHGIPTRILSDRGQDMVSNGVKALCQKWGIAKIETTGYNSTANSHIERFHRYLNASMTILYDKHTNNWDMYLPAILFSYRVTINDSTGFSPAFLTYGREPTLPCDAIFDTSCLDEGPFTSEHDYAIAIEKALSKSFKLAIETQNLVQCKNMKRINEHRKATPDWKPNEDRLWFWMHKSSKHRVLIGGDETVTLRDKWSYWWQGPFKLLRWEGTRCCVIEVGDKEVKTNINRLSKCFTWEGNLDTANWPDHLVPPLDKSPVVTSEDMKHDVKEGQIIVFQMAMTDQYECPIGVGRATKITGDKIQFRWYGNYHNLTNGTYRPSWYNHNPDNWYFRTTKEVNSDKHVPYTSEMTKTNIEKSEILYHGYNILTDKNRLRDDVWTFVKNHKNVYPQLAQEQY